MKRIKDFNLILSGGAALGYAHIGVLQYLYEKKLSPTTLHGVSIGAIVAAVEAMEFTYTEKQKLYEDVFTSLKWIRLRLDGSLISTKKIEDILYNIFGDKKIDELPKELSIGVTNYHDGSLVIFDKENSIKIVDGILASMAVPGLFPPKEIDGKIYVDGYLSSNLPLSSIKNNNFNIIVNVTGKNSYKELDTYRLKRLSIFSNIERSIRILIANQTKKILEEFDKEYILIEPDVSEYKTGHFYKFYEIRQKGYEAAKAFL